MSRITKIIRYLREPTGYYYKDESPIKIGDLVYLNQLGHHMDPELDDEGIYGVVSRKEGRVFIENRECRVRMPSQDDLSNADRFWFCGIVLE